MPLYLINFLVDLVKFLKNLIVIIHKRNMYRYFKTKKARATFQESSLTFVVETLAIDLENFYNVFSNNHTIIFERNRKLQPTLNSFIL